MHHDPRGWSLRLSLLGQLEAVRRQGFSPVARAGTSAGAIVATPFWARHTPDAVLGAVLGFARNGQPIQLVGPFEPDDDGVTIFATALGEFHHRLCVYPPFGDPLIDLTAESGQIRIGTVPPLVMRYGLYEERRLVLVVALPELLPMSGA